MKIAIKHLKQLGELIASGHRKFGKVAPRRPYREEDEGGGDGGKLVFESHPLFQNQPPGATSDLTYLVTDNKYSMDEAENRSSEASPQLTKQLELALSLGKSPKAAPAPNPFTTSV